MKTAIYIEDGTVQLVITPESEFEKNALTTIADKPLSCTVFSGTFYDCRGGWVRQKEHYQPHAINGHDSGDQRIIIRVDEVKDES